MAFTHPSCLSSVCPSLGTLRKQSSGSIVRTHQSRDPEGCTYQSSDPEGYTYQFSDPEGCTYQSSDPEGCTYQSSDLEGYTYPSGQLETRATTSDDLRRSMTGTLRGLEEFDDRLCFNAAERNWASTDTVGRRTDGGVRVREIERKIGDGGGRDDYPT
ncbi:NBS-LRR type resistance protein [Cucumis melo var. makuwa]|uniref:NBS-LRR type resistance protein n=1 Tax=Cucumis melo var. makuwa TaxID=1194695 RepID=A0A5A7T8C3_CUCMM|nr:NBS-LRR type resistance protein [Cucumis melo var. makuwa]